MSSEPSGCQEGLTGGMRRDGSSFGEALGRPVRTPKPPHAAAKWGGLVWSCVDPTRGAERQEGGKPGSQVDKATKAAKLGRKIGEERPERGSKGAFKLGAQGASRE